MQSSQSTQNINSLGLPLPPRSASSNNLSGAGEARHASASHATSGTSTPSFLRSSSVNATGSSTPVPPASPRIPYASSPSLAATAAHHNNYNAKAIQHIVNSLEATSGIGGAGNSVGSGAASAGAIAAANNEGKGEGDAWTAACIRTLPLFNGEGQRGYIEDLNDLITLHIRRSIDRHSSSPSVVNTLAGELVDLLAMGMLTLNAKLTGLTDEALLIRITEVWNFFFIGCLPYIEGIFLPLRTDPVLKQLLARSGAFSSTAQMPNVRSLALQAFRDHLVLPIVDKLAVLFSRVSDSSTTQPVEPSSQATPGQTISSTARTAAARRLQMVSILASLQTNDERQAATEALAKALQAGLERRPSFAALNEVGPSNYTGFYSTGGTRGRGMSDAERKAWRRGRQIRPGPIQHRSDDSRRDAEVSIDGEIFPTANQAPWTRQTEPPSYAVH